MNIYYVNVLLFPLILNILVPKLWNHSRTTTTLPTIRLLCECDIYTSIYDNYPEMKSVMENFERQTFERLKEYDERMKTTRQKCKDKCDKDIQKIILKDKMEKQMAQQLTTLETKIDTNDIPTCICEKTMADKTEKFCLNCGVNVGGGVTLSSGVLGGIAELGLNVWKTAALAAATKDAITKGLAAGEAARIKAGINAVIAELRALGIEELGGATLESFFNETNYMKESLISPYLYMQYEESKCVFFGGGPEKPICKLVTEKALVALNDPGLVAGDPVSYTEVIRTTVETVVSQAQTAADMKALEVTATKTAAFKKTYMAAIEGICNGCHTTIIASIVTILVIVLVMVIIYLILRYRRKRKMMKKLQYIKLLKE
ncbi:surface antigen [Plasmodium falciparum UGT5.1]|uniref:Surface antigen n=1 Tax=Plasmodium falciparum UGT5.1 TaxID=1237627 RepID=W7JJR5_PLAFA|nr:surface antigen [Plasmodium falciparum UGT5.1]